VTLSSLRHLLARYAWAVNLLFLLCVAYLAARTLNVLVGDALRLPPQAVSAASGGASSPKTAPSPEMSKENLAKLLGMKLPDEPVPGTNDQPEAERPADLTSEPVRSSLHAQLLATVVANRAEWSLATLRDLSANKTDVYMVDDGFMGARVLAIESLKVILLNEGHREFIDLSLPGSAPPPGVPPPMVSSADPNNLTAGIKRIDEQHYQIERSTVNSALANLNDLAMQARVVPSFKNGQANGFKLFSIRPDSLYSKIGVQNGDVVQRINGFDMNSPDKALEAYTKLRSAPSLDLQIERNGQTLTYHYAIQ
jgi:general secretion pathway protein C